MLVFGFVKYFFISIFKSLEDCRKSIEPFAFLTDLETAALKTDGLIKPSSNIVFNTARVELTPEALLTNLESVPFVRVRNALPPFCFNCSFRLLAIVFAVPSLPEAHTSPNIVTKKTPPSPSNITLFLYFI